MHNLKPTTTAAHVPREQNVLHNIFFVVLFNYRFHQTKMNQFYSSLVINGKKFPYIHQVLKPRYNKEFFKRLTKNIGQLEAQIDKRCRKSFPNISQVKSLREDSAKIVQLKEQLERLEKKSKENGSESEEHLKIKSNLQALEDRVMPLVVAIPSRSSKHVPNEEVVLQEVKSDFITNENLSKVLSHTKLSYINNCYSKSVVGPNSHYYYGIGAKLQLGLADFFNDQLEKRNFIPISGLCLVKSAVVEATNSKDLKDFTTDPCRVLTADPDDFTSLHLVEASRESLVGFITSIGHIASNSPLRLMTSGAGYRCGTDWFDSDDHRVSQFETLHALIQAPSIEQYSMEEYHNTRDMIWNIYRELELPTRLVHCSLNGMLSNEYDAHRIDVWLPSRKQWIPVSRVSHYLDYITVRAGMKRGHLIDSMVYDGQTLVAAIIENKQTVNGKFIIPSVIKSYIIHLSDSEQKDYFRENLNTNKSQINYQVTSKNMYNNYEQRRYLSKKSYLFSHSRRAERNRTGGIRNGALYTPVFLIAFGWFIDWTEVYIQYVPQNMKRFCYDHIYRPSRRIYWSVVYPEGTTKPNDLAFDELDNSYHEKTRAQRAKDVFYSGLPRREA